MTDKTHFKPAVGTEEKILSHDIQPGYLYLASDTGKIFFDYDTETRIVMGGSGSAIFYATDSNVVDTGYEGIYELHISSLENTTTLPKENDIIINTDNCFYRIVSIKENNNILEATRIAIAGSGGSSGGGTTSGSAAVQSLVNSNLTVLYGEDCNISFNVIATDSSGDETSGGYATWKVDGIVVASNVSVANGENTFNVGSYLETGDKKVVATFALDIGTGINATVIKQWHVLVVNIQSTWEYNTASIVSSSDFDLSWNVSGGDSIEKITHITIDDSIEITKEITNSGDQNLVLDRDEYSLTHGVHKITLYTSFTINNQEFETETISHEIIFVSKDNSTPIIALGDHDSEIQQYDVIMIPIYFYNATTADLLVDGEIKETWADIEKSEIKATLMYWSYSTDDTGYKILTIQSGTTTYNIEIKINSLDLKDVSETTGYAFKLKASDISSNTTLYNWSYITPEKETVNLTFSDNFDWANGGLRQDDTDDNGKTRQYIRIKAGTTMTINYKLFKSSCLNGKNVKIIFKVDNCGKYDATIINSFNKYNQGLLLTAQSAMYKSVNNTITTQYCEDTYTEYEIDITENNPSSSELKYIMPWLSGIPAGIQVFNSDIFLQSADDQTNIIIGSEDCDVCLYLFKVYEKHLTDNQHLNNFIMDAPNATEMLARYTRNDILTDGEIDWVKVGEKNPDCQIHLYRIPRMTKAKSDEIGKSYIKNPEGGFETAKRYRMYAKGNMNTPVIEAGSEIDLPFTYKVQGTSSEKYVISAANLDTKFSSGFKIINEDGVEEIVKKYSLNETAPGENYYNTKVNVASCEGANNALNAAWYNDYQPYICAARTKNANKRDTMLFNPGVVFIYDENPNYKTSGTLENLDLNIFTTCQSNTKDEPYYKNPFYKQYAICNFGNSKKNVNTLHDTDNLSEITVEVTDNQSIGQHMCKVLGRKPYTYVDDSGTLKSDYKLIDITKLDGDKFNTDETVTVEIDGEQTEVTYKDVYAWFRNTMDDEDFDVRYTSAKANTADPGNDGIDNASETQIKGFFKLLQWFALNDVCEYDAENHPYGWTNQPFTEEQLSQTFASGVVVGENSIYFPDYAFKTKINFQTGHEETWYHNYTTTLGGLIVKTYTNTYTTDCKEYRLAKMLSECEDHLIMDSIIYHYLFIERHLLVDNVAKNTFWSSEDKDNNLWNLVKDYDNDTSDGIDNTGKLSFTYGIEPQAKLASGLSYFNAPDSVWFNFIHGLEDARKKMYQSLNTVGAWSATKYIQKFDNWQGTIPERCWIEDYYRKYIRPYKIFKDSYYLAMLEGGQKKYQRRQFETYEELYLNSKYETNLGTAIQIRANTKDVEGISIPIITYSDCYVYQLWGQKPIKFRATRGETYTITCPNGISALDDATVYWYMPQVYSSIGDLGALKPKSVDLSAAIRLQDLSITGNGSSLSSFTSSLSIGEATLLRHLKLKDLDCIGTTDDGTIKGIDLDLSDLKSLQDFDGSGSLFNKIYLPSGAPLTTVILNNPVTIQAQSLNYLETFTINDYSRLASVLINDIDEKDEEAFETDDDISTVNSLTTLILPSLNTLQWYHLGKIKWNITDSSLISNNSITFLDSLLDKNSVDITGSISIDKSNAIDGSLIISSTAYNGENAIDIYDKYIREYPSLDINFESESCKLFEVDILDGNNNITWKRKFQAKTAITEEFLSAGSTGSVQDLLEDIKTSKTSSMEEDFTFNGTWTLIIDGQDDEIIITSSELPLYDTEFSGNATIKPNFDAFSRKYEVNYYFGDNSKTFSVVYNTDALSLSQSFYPYLDDSKLGDKKAYQFMGWSLHKDGTVIKDYSTRKIKNSINFYAIFEEVSVYQNPIDTDYFVISNGTITKIKDNIELKGKITIPATITSIGANVFNGTEYITEVYFENSSICFSIGTSCFSNSKLTYIELPPTITFLGDSCFSSCPYLKLPDLSYCLINSIPKGMYNGSGSRVNDNDKKIETYIIPYTVESIGWYAFRPTYFEIETLILGQIGEDFKLNKIDFYSDGDTSEKKYCFYNSNNNKIVNTIEIYGNNIKTKLKSIFEIEDDNNLTTALSTAFGEATNIHIYEGTVQEGE